MAKTKSKSKSPNSQLSKIDLDAINDQFAALQDETYLRMFANHPEMQVDLSKTARLKKTAKEYLPIFYKQFSQMNCSGLVRELFLKSLIVPSIRMNQLYAKDDPQILAAQAVWLLDTLMNTAAEPEFLKLLPENAPEMEQVLDFYFYDPVHTEEHINAVVYLLAERKKSTEEAYRKVLSLIDKQTVRELTKLFEEHIFDIFHRALQLYRRSQSQPQANVDSLLRAGTADAVTPEMMQKANLAQGGYLAETFLVNAVNFIGDTPKAILHEMGDKHAAELLLTYGIGDPYDLCAAYMILMENDHSLAHMNTLTAIVLSFAQSRLPWNTSGLFLNDSLIDPEYKLRYELHPVRFTQYRDPDDLNNAELLKSAEFATARKNFGQLLYACCDTIQPRKSGPSKELFESLKYSGVPERTAYELSLYSHLMFHVTHQDVPYFDPEHPANGDCVPDDKAKASTPELSPAEQLKAAQTEIESLKQQLARCQQNLLTTERTQSKLAKQLEETVSTTSADREELLHLRETLFQIRSQDENEEPAPDATITFPYSVRNRICIFGGHDSWRKSIKPLLPNARFYDRDELPNADTIRNADAVWIQTNALSHSYFYKIINTAREYKIPVRYFGYASARKCAEEIVEYDKERNARE